MESFFYWIQSVLTAHTFLSPLVYLMSHVLLAVFLIPCSPMTLIAGALWGKWLGLMLSIVSAFLSSCTTFWLSRRFLREKIHGFLSKRYAKTDWFLHQTKKHGWKFVATVQLNPAAPASALGYLFGLTGIEFSVYALFAFVFMLPLQFILVLCGDAFFAVFIRNESWVLMGLLTVLMLVYLGYRFFWKNRALS